MRKAFVVGNISLDLVLGGIPEYPEWGTEALIPGYTMRPGGAASNAALCLARLGVPTFVVGTVGKDGLGEEIRLHFERFGIHTDFLFVIPEKQTGLSVGITNSRTKERSFLTDLGAQESLSCEHIESVIPALEGEDFVLLCGYFLSPRLRTPKLSSVLQDIRQRKEVCLLFDTGWPTEGWREEIKREVRSLVPLFDYFLPNEKELEGLGGTEVALLPRKGTIVKKGEKGCEAHTPLGVIARATIAVEVQDTIGAGDYFNAGFIFALREGYPLSLSLQCANFVASLNIASSPKRDGLLTGEELREILLRRGRV